MNILIVDDTQTNRLTLKLLLKDVTEDIEFFEAQNGKEALEIVSRVKPHLIFMDIMMPVMDGVEATKHLKANQDTKDIFIVAITALSDNMIHKEMLALGVNDYITKPFNYEEIAIRSKNYIDLILKTKSQNKHQSYRKSINVFGDKDIKNFKVVFNITDETDLEEFWDYFSGEKYPNVIYNEIILLIFNISKLALKSQVVVTYDIILEESEHFSYFTIWNQFVKQVSLRYFEKYGSKNVTYRYNEEKITFSVSRVEKKEEPVKKVEDNKKRELIIYRDIHDDDLKELSELVDDLIDTIGMIYTKGFNRTIIDRIINLLNRYISIINSYPDLKWMSNIIGELLRMFLDQKDLLEQKGAFIIPLFDAFISNIKTWTRKIFYEGCDNMHFLDASMVADIQTLWNFLHNKHSEHQSIDDVFNF